MCLVKQNAHWEKGLDIKLKKNTTTPVHFSGVNHNITHLRVMPVELITQLTERKVRENTDPSLARAMPQCFRGELLMIKHYRAVWVISTLDRISHKWLHASEIRSKTTATHRVQIRKMSNRWGHKTYPRQNRQCNPHPGSAFTSGPQSITTHWPVLNSRPDEGRRLSWPWWLGEILRWFFHPKMVTHSSTSGGSRESNLWIRLDGRATLTKLYLLPYFTCGIWQPFYRLLLTHFPSLLVPSNPFPLYQYVATVWQNVHCAHCCWTPYHVDV